VLRNHFLPPFVLDSGGVAHIFIGCSPHHVDMYVARASWPSCPVTSSQVVYFQHRLSPQKLRREKLVVGCGRSHRLFNPAPPEAWLQRQNLPVHLPPPVLPRRPPRSQTRYRQPHPLRSPRNRCHRTRSPIQRRPGCAGLTRQNPVIPRALRRCRVDRL